MQPEEGEDEALARIPPCSDPFLKEAIFQERTKFGDADICPYILILDGWDEISVAVNEGFEVEVRRMLDNVRRQFLHPRAVKVRVLLTGRPSHAVERSQFLRDDTPVLTVRDYTADQFEAYAHRVRSALENRTLPVSAESWPVGRWDGLKKVFTSYRRDPSKLEILGLPLLAHLSLRLLIQWQDDFEDLLSNHTALYRHLLDLTCRNAGNVSSETNDLQGQARLRGLELRKMLQQTAVAITTYGKESIPFRELQLHLKKNRRQMMDTATDTGRDHPLTSLMISFYFKGGREHLGSEFLHKSFREYLCAEAIVETLKEYGRIQVGALPERQPYWKDFEKSDPRWQLSRDLSQLLCPYPLTREIRDHLERLLEWEIKRPDGVEAERQIGEPLDRATLEQWESIRDGLADLWDWWGEAVHLRPQPYRDVSETLLYRPAYVNELMDYSLPRDRSPDAPEWWPGRTVNADSNIGDALCRLNAWVHADLLSLQGWFNDPRGDRELQRMPDAGLRPCQSRLQRSKTIFALFRPAGTGTGYFLSYCSRINASGPRPDGPFPCVVDLSGADLFGANLSGAYLIGAYLIGAYVREAYLRGADLRGADLSGADLSGANLRGANLGGANLGGADLSGADLIEAYLFGAYLRGADLRGADLRGADLSGADLSGADLRGANLSGADLRGAYLYDVDLRGVDLREANIESARGLTQEQINEANGNSSTKLSADLHMPESWKESADAAREE